MPKDVERPLQYAKNELTISRGLNIGENLSTIMFARNLPVIAPVNLAERNLKFIDYTGKIERIVLSKL